MRKLQRGMAATVLLIAATTAQAQSIVGRVVDAKTKEPLIGAVVSLQGTDTKTVTDTDGQFHFYHLSTTTPYTLLVKYVGYKNTTIDGVLPKAEAAEDVITVALKPDEQQLKGVTVTGVKRRNTVTAAVLEVKNSPVIVSNISAQDIKLTQDANAGEVIRRVPGVSLIGDKFVMVRGLAQRYNNVWMNGAAVQAVGWPIGIILDNEKGDTQGSATKDLMKLQNNIFAYMTITGSDFNKVYKDELYDYKTKTTDASKPSFSSSFFTLAANQNSILNWTAMTWGGIKSIIEANQKLSKTAGAFADGNDWTAGWDNWDPENTKY